MKTLIALMMAFSISAFAEPRAEVLEHCSHDIIKLVKTGQLPAEAMNKLHMMQVKEVADGFQVLAVLDHNEDHSQTPGHIRFKYNAQAKMETFQYNVGYVNPGDSPFSKASTAKLFDHAAEALLDSDKQELKDYAKTVVMMHLEFDRAKNAALFEMIDSNKKALSVWLDLDGNFLEHKFEESAEH